MNRSSSTLVCVLAALASPNFASVQAQEKVDFTQHIKPILETSCLSCHGPEKPKGRLRLDTRSGAIKGGDNGTSLVPGKPDESPLYKLTILPADDDALMPPPSKGGPLPKDKTELLRRWIEQGAVWPDSITLAVARKIDFVRDIQPILEFSCVSCHREGHDDGGLRLDTKEWAFKGGDNGPALNPGKPLSSPLYTTTVLRSDHEFLMPPKSKGGPLPADKLDLLWDWIMQGAAWPDGIKLVPRKAEQAATEDLETVNAIHQAILAKLDVTNQTQMKIYTDKISGTDVTFDMVPILGGEFVMGSPEKERGRKPDEGPQHRVAIEPFWMGKHEVTWNEYELFMYPEEEKKIRALRQYNPAQFPGADAVSRPTAPYVEMSFGMGKDGFPAISMTQHAANKYCQWLSAKTGRFYRLPTEAEWEYACRAGTTTAYFFGDDSAKRGDYAWFVDNSDGKYQKIGKKKPNPWGLHDMHGNIAEWTLDQHDPDYYKQFVSTLAASPWNKATKPYPHVARGGSWDDEPEQLRSAARRASDRSWKQQDPQLPKSIWYLTDAQFIGFRVIRPLKVPPPEELSKYWTSGVEKD
ncbi:MAG: hypothetical protein FJ398_08085 [Verrucomicrobia bacterium]|nr:hypothetical protein [Verrucomicrobiota bacterium]